ncbi:3-ketosteroid-9-alpha-monooxygenase, oxygenase component [BD1-7 clade bacterium]|uniref:cholesterol 7-desaturase n=1 Tax=BD1-7 clade bacterium TaxID=2029982 RepID=A0A5S9QQU8_9GAMM|nr:3-ketosteroid-9-alpha-monooxygenase, oxygenase component [BD1-7 clade bacterium]CAA0121867.1 3-ketosteroid-9-alpha-monooxygenase, oxygenase component [BD1-7 clade bacterium]
MSSRYPMPMPYGWFHVSYSDELQSGQAKPIHYFGKEMVLFRTESGEVSCLDAYCPHMGAHLGHGIHEFMGKGGEVSGEDIVCPFHGWKFNTEGFCTDVPYAKNIPPKVKDNQCIPKYHVCERNQSIFVWYHPDSSVEPLWDVESIEEAQFDNEEWGEIENHCKKIRTHIQDIAENGADPAHFMYVHGTAHIPDVQDAEFGKYSRRVELTSKMNTPRGLVDGKIAFCNFGAGQTVTYFSGICDTVLLGLITPIDQEYVEVNFGFIQKKVDGKVPTGGVNAAIKADILKQLDEDTPIWENKIYRPLPILCDGDGPIAKFRRWYATYYADYDESKAGGDVPLKNVG